MGRFSRFTPQKTNKMMQGLTLSSLKKHPALIPLFACVGGGCLWAGYYTLRLAIRNPDVQWFGKNGDLPNVKREWTKQYKFLAPKVDYSKLQAPEERPPIESWK